MRVCTQCLALELVRVCQGIHDGELRDAYMNEYHNFNPDELRVRLAALLQDPTTPYQRYKGPLGAPESKGMGLDFDKMLKNIVKRIPTQAPAPVEDRYVPPDPSGYK